LKKIKKIYIYFIILLNDEKSNKIIKNLNAFFSWDNFFSQLDKWYQFSSHINLTNKFEMKNIAETTKSLTNVRAYSFLFYKSHERTTK